MFVPQCALDDGMRHFDKSDERLTDDMDCWTNGIWESTNDYVYRQPMVIFAIFIMGIGNFALQQAVLRSGHPMLAQLPAALVGAGGRGLQLLEFVVLLAALLLAANGYPGIAFVYAIYTLANGLAAWLVLTGRV